MLLRLGLLFICFITINVNPIHWQIKKTVYRGESPKVGDIFRAVDIKNQEKEVNDILQLVVAIKGEKEWLSASEVLFSSTGIVTSLKGKLWFEICHAFNSDEIKDQVLKQIEIQLGDLPVRITDLTMKNHANSFCINSGEKVKSIQVMMRNRLSERVETQIEFTDGRIFSQVFSVHYEAEIMVVNKRHLINEKIGSQDWQLVWKRINNINIDQILLPITQKLLVKRQLFPGEMLSTKNVIIYPQVQKGEQVKLMLKKGSFSIESKARALSSGYNGDSIKVLVDRATSPVTALIINEGEVSVLH